MPHGEKGYSGYLPLVARDSYGCAGEPPKPYVDNASASVSRLSACLCRGGIPRLSACRLGDGPYARACLGRWPHGLPEGPCSSATDHTSWKCYSALALTPDKSAWSNKAKHPNAYCSGPGAALAAIAKDC